MVDFERFELSNGLKVVVSEDKTTPFAVVDVLYNVGARDENPEKTGFAHLFEHLMFGGSVNIPNYDQPLQEAGGENNAYTTNDYTNYYLTLPSKNIETGFWLESDRMLNLAFSDKALEVQRHVVVEEFKQSYLNQPYGDMWKLIRDMVYKVHPYRWQTIGLDISHIEKATQDDVRGFYRRFYNPCNAILVVAGNVNTEEVRKLSMKWFEPIERGTPYQRNLPIEPEQREERRVVHEADVPHDVIVKVFRMCDIHDRNQFTANVISDILSNGESSRLTQRLTKERPLFSEIRAFITGDIEPGMFVVTGTLLGDTKIEDAEKAIDEELEMMCTTLVTETELEKLGNKIESGFVFSKLDLTTKADNLAYYELIGDAALLNSYVSTYKSITAGELLSYSQYLFRKSNSSTLYYLSKDKKALGK